ncbi:MAG: GTP-dependent dephospho-CoA kinase family protein [Methanomassiliicoccales archaeon]
MREQLHMPFGVLVNMEDIQSEIRNCQKLITVGDVVTSNLLQNGLLPDILIFDFRTKREHADILKDLIEKVDGTMISVKNPASHISPDLVETIRGALNEEGRIKIFVDGEEDLAALVCVALAPVGTCLIYGLPDKGMVFVRVNDNISKKAKAIICKMEECE